MKKQTLIIISLLIAGILFFSRSDDPIEKFFSKLSTAMTTSKQTSLLATATKISSIRPYISPNVFVKIKKNHHIEQIVSKQQLLRALTSFISTQPTLSMRVSDLEVSYHNHQAFASAIIILSQADGNSIFDINCEFSQDQTEKWMLKSIKQSDILEK